MVGKSRAVAGQCESNTQLCAKFIFQDHGTRPHQCSHCLPVNSAKAQECTGEFLQMDIDKAYMLLDGSQCHLYMRAYYGLVKAENIVRKCPNLETTVSWNREHHSGGKSHGSENRDSSSTFL